LVTHPSVVSVGSRAEAAFSNTYKQLNLFGEVFERARGDYVEKPDDNKLVESAINGMLAGLDPHSSYMDPNSFRDITRASRSSRTSACRRASRAYGPGQIARAGVEALGFVGVTAAGRNDFALIEECVRDRDRLIEQPARIVAAKARCRPSFRSVPVMGRCA
jgi:hypothetical protein